MALDTYFNSVALMLHGDGVNGSTSFPDTAYYPRALTVSGTPTVSTAQSKFGGASIFYDGSSWHQSGVPGDSAFAAEFTIEAFVYPTRSANEGLFGNEMTNGFRLVRQTDGTLLMYWFNTAIVVNFTSVGNLPINTWTHVAVCRQAGVVRLFVNGVVVGSLAYATAFLASDLAMRFGHGGSGGFAPFLGYMDEARVTNDIGRYGAAGFTVATAAYPDDSPDGKPVRAAFLTAPMAVLSGYSGANAALAPPSPTLGSYGGASTALIPPSPALYASGHDSTGELAANLSAPGPLLSAYGGANARLTAPSPALAITATVTGWGAAALSAPMATLAAAGTVSAMAGAALTAPMATLIGYSGAVCSITGPMGTLLATGNTGATGRAALSCPLFELTASGTARNHGSANLIAPSPKLGGTAQAYLIAPMGKLTAIGTATVVASYEAYSINLSHTPRGRGELEPVDQVTRYTNFPFTQIVRYRNSYFGVAADGLYLLEGTTDNGAPIAYAVKTCVDDLKAAEKKTAASVYLAGRIGPSLTVTLHAGETGQESYPYSTPRGQGAQNHREKFGRGVKNRYFALSLAGTDALELDSLELEINKLNRRI